MAAYDDLDDKRIFSVGILSVVVLAVTALAVQIVFYLMENAQDAKTAAEGNYGQENNILAEQTAEISSFGVDPLTAEIMIPIDQAIQKVVKQRETSQDNKHGAPDKSGDSSKSSNEQA
jgi:hypothetical protein